MDLSDSWGVATSSNSQAWILSSSSGNLSMNAGELLSAGRAGLRVGNAKILAEKARAEGVSPDKRVQKYYDPESGSSAALRACGREILSTFDPVRLVSDVVQDLFPMSQAIHESAPMSACLRYSIEHAR